MTPFAGNDLAILVVFITHQIEDTIQIVRLLLIGRMMYRRFLINRSHSAAAGCACDELPLAPEHLMGFFFNFVDSIFHLCLKTNAKPGELSR